MPEKTWIITYLDDTPSLKVEAESFIKAVEKVKDKLSCADLKEASLRGASLIYAYLRGASMRRADLSGADLSVADLKGANLIRADLSGAKGLPKKIRDAYRA